MNKGYAIAAVAVAAVFLLGTVWFTSQSGGDDKYAQCRSGAVGGDLGGPFELVNAQGQTVTDKDVITEPSLIYFGYTY